MTAFSIRAFRPDDGEALAELHRRAILATSADYYTDAEKASWAYGISGDLYVAHEGGSFEVAVDGSGVPIALCHNAGDEILGLYIDPDWQRRGLGRTLIERAERDIAGRGSGTARVKATISAQPFYEAQGYRFVAPSPHETRGGLMLAAVLLEKAIGPR